MSNRSRYGQTVYLPKLKGSRAVPLHRRRLEIGSGGNGYDEDWLQRLLFETPEILPIGEIDPAFAPATPLCRELPTAAGPIDLAYMSEEGRLSIVECKLWRNPEARRGAVSQILDYAKEISRWSYDELNDAVCRAARRSGNTNALFDIVRAQHDTLDEATFVDDVARSLTSGRFLLIVVGDGIREGVERIADYLNQSAGIRITFGLVELAIFDMPEGSAGRGHRRAEGTRQDDRNRTCCRATGRRGGRGGRPRPVKILECPAGQQFAPSTGHLNPPSRKESRWTGRPC